MALPTRLVPSPPSETTRYEPALQRVVPDFVKITPGLFSFVTEAEPPYLPEGWTMHVQAEGKPYYACETSPRVVTEDDVAHPDIRGKVLRAIDAVREEMAIQNVSLPDSAELCLRIKPDAPEDDDFRAQEVCEYYFADHAAHVVWWLHEVDSETVLFDMGIVSESHLRMGLESQYWSHIEQFSAHRIERLHLAIDELIAVFVHGEADQRTSMTSCFPYTSDQCKHFIRILGNANTFPQQTTGLTVIARMWCNIATHRFQTMYGQCSARLDRHQRILEDSPNPQRGMLFGAASRLLFNIPAQYAAKFDHMYTDGIIYGYVFRDFLCETANVLFTISPRASPELAAASLLCCALAIATALALMSRHTNRRTYTAGQAQPICATSSQEDNARLAIAWAFPRAAFLWAAALATLQAPLFVARAFGLEALAGVLVFAFLVSRPWVRWALDARAWWSNFTSKPEAEVEEAGDIKSPSEMVRQHAKHGKAGSDSVTEATFA
ncbi:uncharacterized protein BXZ73DRAFT_98025 [Epithele typhae]|uniref:uncharacterized protein n=1 Tax=Epithele typhae TaxID=378194 RepID=UPI0020079709|nr:uncharacterized protein BXZ73DRAFT_98025 [Epithele typhae]KAH9941637.1 hypothetical protein BXZ73DRAFT_98025 [Epithele typhae]